MFQNRPLYDNRADASLFVVPSVWDSLLRALDRDLNVLLVGGRGSGKTTLLRQVQLALKKERRVVYVDATAIGEVGELAWRIRDAIAGRPSPIRTGIRALQTVSLPDPNPPVAGATHALYDVLQDLAEQPSALILLDASSSGKALYELFGRMRDVLWQQEHQWAVAVDDDDRATALKPPADAFFDVILELDDFHIDDLVRILERRSEDSAPAIRGRVAAGAGGNPRAAIRALNEALVTEQDPDEALSERARVLDAAANLGRPHGMLMAELLDRGQASPSDEALQQSLGLSRGRLTDYLRTLLNAGLVVAETERSDKPGRPRTSYRPALFGDR